MTCNFVANISNTTTRKVIVSLIMEKVIVIDSLLAEEFTKRRLSILFEKAVIIEKWSVSKVFAINGFVITLLNPF